MLGEPGSAAATGVITIDLPKIAGNWRRFAEYVRPAGCAAVVKADCYGLGAGHVLPALWRAGCRTFFVATPDEAEEARTLLPEATIYALDGLCGGAADLFAGRGIRPVLSTPDDVETWAQLANSRNKVLPAGLHVDTGLHRLGLSAAAARQLATDKDRLGALGLDLVMSHLACADVPADAKNRDQLLAFETLSALFPGVPRSLAASDGLMIGPNYHFDLVRPGYGLYGGQVSAHQPVEIVPAVKVEARILQIQTVLPGETVGYAAAWRAERLSQIATIAAGYADGLPRSASGTTEKRGGQVKIGNYEVPVIGRVSMDLITADVTGIPTDILNRHTYATLLGDGLSLETAGFAAGTIGYEILTRLGQRFKRTYIEF